MDYLGASPQTPWVGFAEFWAKYINEQKPRRANVFGSF
jgi:hypothetical protein